jgi:hypothetical protein
MTINMQTPHDHPSRVTLSNLVKVPHAFSHHANSKPSAQRCDHTPLPTTDRKTDLTPDQTIHLLHIQDQTMIADLQHTKLAHFNNRIAAQDHPSDQLHPTIQTKDVLQTVTMLQDKIPAHPTQQTLYATTAED